MKHNYIPDSPETFLKAYAPDKWDVERLTVLNQMAEESPLSPQEQAALAYLDESILENGTISVALDFPYGSAVTELAIPASIRGLPVTQLREMSSIPDQLKKLILPASITDIEGFFYLTFYQGGHSMEAIEVAEDNPIFWADGQALYTKDRKTLIRMMNFQASRYTIHPDTEVIGEAAFAEFENLQALTLPARLREIREQAFYDCQNLEEIIGIESVPKIAEGVLNSTKYYANQKAFFNGTVLQKYAETGSTAYTVPEGTTAIAPGAFYVNDSKDCLTSLIIPDSVTEIARQAFAGRKKLRSIRLPAGLKKLDSQILQDCIALQSLHIPAGVEEIAENALPGNRLEWRSFVTSALSQITVDENNSHFMAKDNILYSKDGGTLIFAAPGAVGAEFTVPDHVHTIGQDAFRGMAQLQRLHLPASVKTLARGAFQECRKLESIHLPHVEVMEESVFSDCPELVSATLYLPHIPGSAFSRCKLLSQITLHGTKSIGERAFCECSGLTGITLPDGLESVGASAFRECSLKQVIVPKTVRIVQHEAFSGCPDITVYDTIDPEAKPAAKHLDSVNGSPNSQVGFIGIGPAWAMWTCAANHRWVDHRITVRSAETDEIKFVVPMVSDSTQRSYYCTLTSSWGKNATFHFDALDAFFSNIKGVPIKLEVAVSRLRYPVELDEGQRKAYIAYLVRTAKDLVKGCIDRDDMETLLLCEPFGILKKNNIAELLEYAETKQAVSFTAYLLEYQNTHFLSTTMRMPSLSDKPLKAAAIWQAPKAGTSKVGRYKGTDKAITFPTELNGAAITGIAGTTSKVPQNYQELVSVVIPEGYITIGDYAFHGCKNLESVTLPSTLESIGKDAFSYCSKLKEIILPDSVSSIGENCFYNCKALTTLRLSENLSSIPGAAFYGTGLQSVHLPSKVNYVYKDCFYWCSGLKDVYYHGAQLIGSGQCFSGGNFHCYTDARVDIYDVTPKRIKVMTIAGHAADTALTLQLGDAAFSFSLEACAGNMRAKGSTAMCRLLQASGTGKELARVLDVVYGGKLLAAAGNTAELQRLEALEIPDTVVFTEEKKHADGTSVTVFTYSKAGSCSLKVKETLSGSTVQTHTYGYHTPYAIPRPKNKKAPADGFVDISDSHKIPADSHFRFSQVESLEFEKKIFVLTGFDAEEEQRITEIITARGGEVKSSVVKKTDYLIVQDSDTQETTKYKKALDLLNGGAKLAIVSSSRFYALT